VTPNLILRSHNDGERKIDVDRRGGRHNDNWGRTLREEEQLIDGGKGKAN